MRNSVEAIVIAVLITLALFVGMTYVTDAMFGRR
jgi:hypothetical protein